MKLEPNVRHFANSIVPEYTACGMAFDAYESGDAEEQIIFAAPGETVTCVGSRKIIADAKMVRHWKVRNEKLTRKPHTEGEAK